MACPHRGLSARLRRLALLLVIGLPVPGMASPPSSTASAQPARLQVIGYVVDEPQLPPISAGKLDAINFAFAKVDATGAAYLPGDTATRSLVATLPQHGHVLGRRRFQLGTLARRGRFGVGLDLPAVALARRHRVEPPEQHAGQYPGQRAAKVRLPGNAVAVWQHGEHRAAIKQQRDHA
ncbi:MAG: hypothetical protein J7521_23855, partial [Caulobacter sp.]|nr:hypothetical protein [Caulobacter sp.]